MDPGVTAAVIAAPTAVLAAAAAYAGARSQARSAHRGPVDAVRRQHQRDAYAAFLAAVQEYETATAWRKCYAQARREGPPSGISRDSPELLDLVLGRAFELARSASLEEVMRTSAVVELEGPDDIAAAATITVGLARRVRWTSLMPVPPSELKEPYCETHSQLQHAIFEFVRLARAQLNGVGG
ncbi:hypothetical protein [Streptomyces sp. 049-1]|uniref:hypothetical protein n=1 Tax=Streptomyces sp. 049-1 TaxID=2789264 RepID=UPI00397EC9B2